VVVEWRDAAIFDGQGGSVTTDRHGTDAQPAPPEGPVQMLSLVLESLAAAVVAADSGDRIIFWNRGATRLFGREYADVAGHEFATTVVHRDGREQFATELDAIHRGEHVHTDVSIVRPDGERVAIVFDRSPVLDEQGRVVGWAAWALDAADHRRQRREVESRATQDAATGLLNRSALEEQLRFALDRAGAQPDVAMAAMLIRFDGYEGVREASGDAAADRLLSDAAHRIRGALRAGDMLGRLGDDFLLVLPELRAGSGYGLDEWSRASGHVVTKKVERATDAAFTVEGEELRLVPRVGLGVFPFDARDVAGLLAAADRASRGTPEN
jgi:PAS domain S-box-containing protein/diguanylate cyclase (GGDEF)-like protein